MQLLHLGPGLRGRAAQARAEGGDDAGLREPVLGQADPEQFQRRPVRVEQGDADGRGALGGELEDHRQVVGQFAVEVDQQPGIAVGLLDRREDFAASPGVAVGPVGQVEGVAA